MLREDPAYFQDALKTRYEMILYVSEKVYRAPLTESLKERSLHQVCRTMVHDPYKNIIIWDISKTPLGRFCSYSRLLLKLRENCLPCHFIHPPYMFFCLKKRMLTPECVSSGGPAKARELVHWDSKFVRRATIRGISRRTRQSCARNGQIDTVPIGGPAENPTNE